MVVAKFEFHIAALSDLLGVLQGLRISREQRGHFLFTFNVELLRFKFHASGVVHRFLHLDAHEHILHGGILPADVMGVIGCHHGKTGFPGDPPKAPVHSGLLLQAVVLKLQIKILRPKYLGHVLRRFQGALIVILHELLRDLTGKARR